MSDNCQGAKFEILLDGKTQSCRDTMLTAMGAAKLIQSQNPNSKVAVKLANPPGARFEILVDGKPRSYRDVKAVAIASAEFLKSRNPHSEVAVKDLQSGEVTVVTRGWDR